MACKINKIGLGSVQWGIKYGISNLKGRTKEYEVKKILDKAKLENISIIDTSPQYGDAERVLGMNDLKEFKIVTKTDKFLNKKISLSDQKNLISTLEKSILKLSVKSVYGLLIHNVDDLFKIGGENLILSLRNLQEKKLVSKIGISIYNSNQIKKALKIFKPDIIQLPLNVFDQRLIKDGTLKLLTDQNIEIHARSIFLQGLFFIKKNNLHPYFNPWEKQITNFQYECKLNKITPLKAALSFVINIPEVSKCIVGVNNLNQLDEILDSIKKPKIIYKDFSINNENLINPINWNLK